MMTTAERIIQGKKDLDEVLDAGKEAESREKWNKHIDALNKSAFTYGFAGKGWNDDTFTPYTDIVMPSGRNAGNVFAYSGVTDLKGILERYGTKLDCTNALNTSGFFQYSLVTRVPEIVLERATTISSMFGNATNLVSVDKLTVPVNCVLTNAFQNCTRLNYIRIGGTIGKTIDIHWSPLSKESVESVVSALSDTVTGQTVTFNKTYMENIDDGSWWNGQYGKATAKGWNVSLIDIQNS